jgi:hypothetical protein
MFDPNESSFAISKRLKSRLRRRYLRWYSVQPSRSFFRADGWRSFWRSYNRRANAVFAHPAVHWLAMTLVVGVALCLVGVTVAVLGFLGQLLPMVFFAPVEAHPFESDSQRTMVAFTRLTIYQTAAMSLLLIYSAVCSHAPGELNRRRFFDRRKNVRDSLRGLSIAGLCLFLASTMCVIGVTYRSPYFLLATLVSLLTVGCVCWLVVALARRLIGLRLLRLRADLAVAGVLVAALVLLLPFSRLCYGISILEVSESLAWLGPMGFVNSLLYSFSIGRPGAIVPLGSLCVTTAVIGCYLYLRSRSWTFHRRLISMVEILEVGRTASENKAQIQPAIERELRRILSRSEWRSWRAIFYPRWIEGNLPIVFVLLGSVFAAQMLLISMGVMLTNVEAMSDVGPQRPSELMFVLAANAAGWSILLFEGMAWCYRDSHCLTTFARRPVSPWDLWRESQWRGIVCAPTQVVYTLPFILLTASFSPKLLWYACYLIGPALLSCIALRTLVVAAVSYGSAIFSHLTWTSIVLQWVGGIVGLAVLSGMISQVNFFAPGVPVRYMLQQQAISHLFAFTAFSVAFIVWRIWADSSASRLSISRSLMS